MHFQGPCSLRPCISRPYCMCIYKHLHLYHVVVKKGKKSIQGSPTYVVFTTRDPTTTFFGLSRCKCGNATLVVQEREFCSMHYFPCPKIPIRWRPSVACLNKTFRRPSTRIAQCCLWLEKASIVDSSVACSEYDVLSMRKYHNR